MNPRLSLALLAIALLPVACLQDEQDSSVTGIPPTETSVSLESPSDGTLPAVAEATIPSDTAIPMASATPTELPGPSVTPIPPTATPTVTPTSTPAARLAQAIRLAPIVGGLISPTYVTHAFDRRLFVAEQAGRIMIVENGQVLPTPFLDIRDRVSSDALERGLFSAAFHPNFPQDGRFYVNYTDRRGDTVISRFSLADGSANQADPNSETVLLNITQPYANHNGGQLQFGPDGYLYVGMGDGGSAGDPLNNGQDSSTLLGALLRLDVDNGTEYAIPPDNPWPNGDAGRPEVWAIGLRNPWRFSFDRLTGDLYLADVGQNLWEEINFQPAGHPAGLNYGWNILEGSHCYQSPTCDPTTLVVPVAEYEHVAGNCSVTGGYIYRGRRFPTLEGNYFFGDYCSGWIWSLIQQADGDWTWNLILDSELLISSFGEDVAGELYVVDQRSGTIYQLESAP